ncbi:MAG: arsenate reductase ArsC [Chloroflexi bacterium]|nr:arsenate reductase ArsC [Chloroflexota bacterium]
MRKMLFVCVHNAGRSQMAEAFFNQMAKGKARGFSAGTQPADKVNPVVVEAMREVGIDISRRKPKMLTLKMLEDADRVITMGCGVEGICPASFVQTEDWQLEDPEGKPMERVRQIRDEVKVRVEGLIKEHDNGENFT